MQNSFGVRGIGARPSVRTIEALRELSEKIIGLTNKQGYRKAATVAVQTGTMRVLVPATLWEESLDDFFRQAATMQSYGNTAGEPCYPSLEQANAGRNEDGSIHGGFLVVDVIERLVVDLIGDDGKTRLRTPLVQFATAEKVVA